MSEHADDREEPVSTNAEWIHYSGKQTSWAKFATHEPGGTE